MVWHLIFFHSTLVYCILFTLYYKLFCSAVISLLYVVFRAQPGQPCGMITVVGHILQKEHIFGLWRGMTPVSFDPLIAIVTFSLFKIYGFYVEVPENTCFKKYIYIYML